MARAGTEIEAGLLLCETIGCAMNVLIISPEPWHTNQVSKHHYARTLAKRGHKVYFLEPPVAGPSAAGFHRVPGEAGEIWTISAPRVAPGLRFMPKPMRRALEKRWLERLESRIGSAIDIVWLFENSRFYDMSFAGDRLKIYHQMDLDQDYHVATAAATADAALAVSDIILRRVAPHAKFACKIRHGLLLVAPTDQLDCSKVRAGRVAAGYIGNFDSVYLSERILFQTATLSPDVDFHLIGSYRVTGSVYRSLHSLPNVFFWGRLPSNKLPAALAGMDLMVMTYDTDNHRDQLANPHKLMEYLATGKVVVSTFAEEYAALAGGSIAMVERMDDFPEAFRSVVASLDQWNTAELRSRRTAFAKDNTYERQLERISAALSSCPAIVERFGEITL